jgi:alkanesulfonate monooxygenase SsuD/methylene tetrahydromethanopterin reductase-like flavin-dependent oxidoreductase (luciferase family)
MLVTVHTLPDHTTNPFTGHYNETPAERYEWLIQAAVASEQKGFNSFWVGEHHGQSRYLVPSPQVLLAAIAARTSRLELGAGVVILPLCNPLRVAEEFAVLDLISKGRAILGLGSGLARDSFTMFDEDATQASEMSREKLDAIVQLWSERNISKPRGKFVQGFNNVTLFPRTYRDRPLPIVRACAKEESAIDAARRGQRITLHTVGKPFDTNRRLADLYRENYIKSGHDPKEMSVGVIIMAHCVLRDGESARKHWHQYIDHYFIQGGKTAAPLSNNGSPQPGVFHPSHICGTADEIADMLEVRYREVGGWDELNCIFDNGGIPGTEAMDSLLCFGETAIPLLQQIGGRSSHPAVTKPPLSEAVGQLH